MTDSPVCLIVDDEPVLAEFMAAVATDFGWWAHTANTEAEFERWLADCPPDLIALDLAMPGHDGVQLIRRLAEVSYPGNLVIVSACDVSILQASVELAGLRGLRAPTYAQKPLEAHEFEDILRRADPRRRD